MNEKQKFVPILLGSDINVYGMSRSFHEAYGIVSEAYAGLQLAPTKYSKIVNVHVVKFLFFIHILLHLLILNQR
jgi:D-aspartate ligase